MRLDHAASRADNQDDEMSDHPKFDEEDRSGLRARVEEPQEATVTPIAESTLRGSIDVQLDEMLHRLHAHDYLAALILAETVAAASPGHGLATVCRKEATLAVKPLMAAPLTVVSSDGHGLSPEARAFLSVVIASPSTPVGALLPSETQGCITTLRALHELLGVGAIRGAPVLAAVERADTIPAPPSKH